MTNTPLPIGIIGAGAIGLAAAAQLIKRGETPIVLEAGEGVSSSIRRWGHVRLFSPWNYLVDSAAEELLTASGWTQPDPQALPTGRELVEGYLEPLALLPQIAPLLRFNTKVTDVTRKGYDKMKTTGRDRAPFVLTLETPNGEEHVTVRAVIDASGTYTSPNPLGAGGSRAAGEARVQERIYYGIPDVLGRDRSRYAGRRVLVVGSGHSAFNALLDLATLAAEVPATTPLWAIRRREPAHLFGGGDADALSARGSLGTRMKRLVETGAVELLSGFSIERLEPTKDGIRVVTEEGEVLENIHEIIATTGFRPELEMLRELRLSLDPTTESPVALAPLIDPNVHSCGTVYPHGANELAHPEKDFYIVGMKSYGRAPTFLLLTGYEQVRSVVCALTGDVEGANAVELVLPETGVCSSDLAGGSCSVPQPAGVPADGFAPLVMLDGGGSSCGTGAASSCCGGQAEGVAEEKLEVNA